MPKDPKSWIEEPLYTQIKSVIPIPCVDLLIVHHNRLLLMLRNNEPGKDLWFSPGEGYKKARPLKKPSSG